jgi:hypothetical protein
LGASREEILITARYALVASHSIWERSQHGR